MSTEQLQVNFRMPASLKARLEAEASRTGRSLTAEIVQRLEHSLAKDRTDTSFNLAQIEEMFRKLWDGVVMMSPEESRAFQEFQRARTEQEERLAAASHQIAGQDQLEEAAKQQAWRDKELADAARKLSGQDQIEKAVEAFNKKRRKK